MAALTKPARVVSQSLLRLQTDARLAQLARDGHEPAFETLVERYRPELVRASGRIVGPDRSEDAVQQALLNAHRAIDTTENVQNLRAWLHRIAQNSSLNILRSVRDEVPLENQPNVASAMAGPADSAELSERLNETLAAIDTLPENQRAALLLRELEGRSHEDIAASLGVTTGAARQHLMRARQGVRSAVTVLTPYPLIASLATPSTSAGLAEIVFGAGASATALKLGASVAATGAIAGGVFGAPVGIETHATDAAQNRTTTTSQPNTNSSPATIAPALATDDNSSKGKSGEDDNSSKGKSGDDNRKNDNSGRGNGGDLEQQSGNQGRGGGDASGRGGGRKGSGGYSGSGSSGSGSNGSGGGGALQQLPEDNSGSGSSGSGSSGSSGSDSSGSGGSGDDGSGGDD